MVSGCPGFRGAEPASTTFHGTGLSAAVPVVGTRFRYFFSEVSMLRSIPEISQVLWFRGPEADQNSVPDLFIELPHGATELSFLEQTKKLVSQYPEDRYDDFFMVNTDQGSPEYAFRAARYLTDIADRDALFAALPSASHQAVERRLASLSVCVLRCLLPRTIVDTNRRWDQEAGTFKAANLTGVVGSFLTDEKDLAEIKSRYDAYCEQARQGYDWVCGNGGLALNLHTYSPVSVELVEGEYIIDTLHRAYSHEFFPKQTRRPPIELITADLDGPCLAPRGLVDDLLARYRAMGYAATENEPFYLHQSTTGYTYAAKHQGKVLVMEIARDLLAEKFEPFSIMTIPEDKAAHFALPLAAAVATALTEKR